MFLFRGQRGDYLKALYWDGSGICLFAKRLEQGRFVWPPFGRPRHRAELGTAGAAHREHQLVTHRGTGSSGRADPRLNGTFRSFSLGVRRGGGRMDHVTGDGQSALQPGELRAFAQMLEAQHAVTAAETSTVAEFRAAKGDHAADRARD